MKVSIEEASEISKDFTQGSFVSPLLSLLTDYDNNTCVPCEANCGSCQDRPDYCTLCEHNLVMHEHKCFSSCPLHTYETEENK